MVMRRYRKLNDWCRDNLLELGLTEASTLNTLIPHPRRFIFPGPNNWIYRIGAPWLESIVYCTRRSFQDNHISFKFWQCRWLTTQITDRGKIHQSRAHRITQNKTLWSCDGTSKRIKDEECSVSQSVSQRKIHETITGMTLIYGIGCCSGRVCPCSRKQLKYRSSSTWALEFVPVRTFLHPSIRPKTADWCHGGCCGWKLNGVKQCTLHWKVHPYVATTVIVSVMLAVS